jgi:hypothetical protein
MSYRGDTLPSIHKAQFPLEHFLDVIFIVSYALHMKNEERLRILEEIGARLNREFGNSQDTLIGILNSETGVALVEAIEQLQDKIVESTDHLNRGLDQSVTKLIASNEKLAESNDRHARAMKWLTFGLLVAASVQAAALIIPFYQ